MKSILVICFFGMLAGCVQQQVETTTIPPQDTVLKTASPLSRAKIHTELAEGYYQRGQMGFALDDLKQALDTDPNYAPAYNVRGLVYMQLHQNDEAERDFRRALEIDPLDSDTNNNYGWFLCQNKHEDESIKYFMAALKNPLYATPEKSYVNSGICMRRKGDDKAALAYFNKALQIRPDQPLALYNMAELSYKRGQYTDANAYLVRYMRVAAPTAQTLWLGVRTERKLGDRDAEASYALQLRKKYPDSAEARALDNGQFE
ncbi:MAG TPA: type IV pilus biogenesis/stability protein PilW [Burkholderiales bacterium]|nr:type IV pilus biogenesis/stability protein PilW [Burkholderiales bacterium]